MNKLKTNTCRLVARHLLGDTKAAEPLCSPMERSLATAGRRGLVAACHWRRRRAKTTFNLVVSHGEDDAAAAWRAPKDAPKMSGTAARNHSRHRSLVASSERSLAPLALANELRARSLEPEKRTTNRREIVRSPDLSAVVARNKWACLVAASF